MADIECILEGELTYHLNNVLWDVYTMKSKFKRRNVSSPFRLLLGSVILF